jgi:hypothetical protein
MVMMFHRTEDNSVFAKDIYVAHDKQTLKTRLNRKLMSVKSVIATTKVDPKKENNLLSWRQGLTQDRVIP